VITGVRFVSRAKETLMVNLAPRQPVLLSSALPSPLTVHTTLSFQSSLSL